VPSIVILPEDACHLTHLALLFFIADFGGYPGSGVPQGYGQSGYQSAQYGSGAGGPYGSVGAYGGVPSYDYNSAPYASSAYGAPSYGYGVTPYGYGGPSYGYGVPSHGYGSDPYAGMGYGGSGYGSGTYGGGILGSSITNPPDLDNDGVPDHLQETKVTFALSAATSRQTKDCTVWNRKKSTTTLPKPTVWASGG
jgi:hypothetical protein